MRKYLVRVTLMNRETWMDETIEFQAEDRDEVRAFLKETGSCIESYDCFQDIEHEGDDEEY